MLSLHDFDIMCEWTLSAQRIGRRTGGVSSRRVWKSYISLRYRLDSVKRESSFFRKRMCQRTYSSVKVLRKYVNSEFSGTSVPMEPPLNHTKRVAP